MCPFIVAMIAASFNIFDKSAPESIHLCDYPVADESLIDETLNELEDCKDTLERSGEISCEWEPNSSIAGRR